MSGGRRSKLSPSLFPFLAVLVCTLGTLILLLALVAQKANDAAVAVETQTSDSEVAGTGLPTPASERQHPGLTAETVSSMIDEEQFRVTQLVTVRQSQTADIEQRRDQLAHIEDHTRRLTEELKRLSDEVERASKNDSDQEISEQQLAILQRQIEIEEREIEKKLAESGTRKPRVIIVPHKGPNGTDRRPIYLECTGDELVIWPEQIRISIEQLQQSDTGANPVESALRVIRHHAMSQYGDPVPPYPLLIVRPDGIMTYAMARGAMQDYDDQFGYELVPDHVELAIAKPDANLKRKLDQAITQAIANQTRLERIAQQNNIGSGRRLPVLSAAELDREGRSSGYRSLGRDEQNLYTQQAGDARSIARSYADDRANTRSSLSSVGTGNSDRYGNQGSGENSGIDPAMEQQWTEDMQQAASELSGSSLDGSGRFDEVGNPKSVLDSYLDGADGDVTEADGNTNQVNQPNGLAGQANESAEAKMSMQNPSSASGGAAGASQPPSGQQASGPSQNMASQNLQPPSSDAQSRPPENSYSQTPTEDLATPGSPGWALPRDVAKSHGNEILRTIRAESRSDRFVLLPSDRRSSAEMFGVFDHDARRASLELATAVRDRVDQWGAALPGGRWQPVLQVDVKPGGEIRFEQLRRILRDSGVNVVPKN